MSAALIETAHGAYLLSTDPARLDRALIHRFLAEEAYWARGRTRETSDRAIDHSHLVIGAYAADGAQVGFARMVTDLATWAWLCDVFVLPDHRGDGLGKAMVGTIIEHPDVIDVKRQFLATADAHGLYAGYGYRPLADPTKWMERSPDA